MYLDVDFFLLVFAQKFAHFILIILVDQKNEVIWLNYLAVF